MSVLLQLLIISNLSRCVPRRLRSPESFHYGRGRSHPPSSCSASCAGAIHSTFPILGPNVPVSRSTGMSRADGGRIITAYACAQALTQEVGMVLIPTPGSPESIAAAAVAEPSSTVVPGKTYFRRRPALFSPLFSFSSRSSTFFASFSNMSRLPPLSHISIRSSTQCLCRTDGNDVTSALTSALLLLVFVAGLGSLLLHWE